MIKKCNSFEKISASAPAAPAVVVIGRKKCYNNEVTLELPYAEKHIWIWE